MIGAQRKNGQAKSEIAKLLRFLGALFSFISVALIIASSTMSWGTLDVKTKIGPIPVTLKADVYEYGINYEADLNGTQGILAGVGGGMMTQKIAANKVFLYGLGEFQETIGFVKGSSKVKVIATTSYTWPPPNNGTAVSNITFGVKSIPWWPVGLDQEVNLTVELTAALNVSEVKVVRVWFELRRPDPGSSLGYKYKVAWQGEPGDVLTKVGDKRTYSAKLKADDDFGEFSVVGQVWLELKDSFGNTNRIAEGSYRELTAPAKEVKLWTLGTEKSVRVALLVAAFPLSILASGILISSSIVALLGKRREWQLCLVGAILAILAVAFYASGVYALIDLTGYSDWFSWSPMFMFAIVAAFLSIVPVVLMFLGRTLPPPKAPTKKDVKVKPGAKSRTGKEVVGQMDSLGQGGSGKRTSAVKKGPEEKDTAGEGAPGLKKKAPANETPGKASRPEKSYVMKKDITNKYMK